MICSFDQYKPHTETGVSVFWAIRVFFLLRWLNAQKSPKTTPWLNPNHQMKSSLFLLYMAEMFSILSLAPVLWDLYGIKLSFLSWYVYYCCSSHWVWIKGPACLHVGFSLGPKVIGQSFKWIGFKSRCNWFENRSRLCHFFPSTMTRPYDRFCSSGFRVGLELWFSQHLLPQYIEKGE